jgi:triacylglycerol lipase
VPIAMPEPTLGVLTPPNLDRTYFEDGEDHPFQVHAPAFDPVNAWWLAEAALLAYARVEDAIPRYHNGGFEAELIDGPVTDTQAYVLVRDDLVVVAFRGTQFPRFHDGQTHAEMGIAFGRFLKDAMVDGRVALVEGEPHGRVHRGFKGALDEIQPRLKNRIDALEGEAPARPFFFTGHSLGAALATLAAARFPDLVKALYVYGCPALGDGAFADAFPVQSAYRVVHNNDVVALVPSVGPLRPPLPLPIGHYAHVGQLWYLDSAGAIHGDPTFVARVVDALADRFRAFLGFLGQLPVGHVQVPFDGLADHAPLYYALRLRNLVFP